MPKLIEVPLMQPSKGILVNPDQVAWIEGFGPDRSDLHLSGGGRLDIKMEATDLAKRLGFKPEHHSAS